MTTPIPSHSSARSSTGRASRPASAASRTPTPSAGCSSAGTTKSTAIQASAQYTRRFPLRQGRAGAGPTWARPRGRLSCPPRALRAQAPHTTGPPHRGVDQPAGGRPPKTVFLSRSCLIKLDRHRAPRATVTLTPKAVGYAHSGYGTQAVRRLDRGLGLGHVLSG
jgi:hypothetical protein